MRALLVMDMQENLISEDSQNLIDRINGEISKFDKNNVFYIKTNKKQNILTKFLSKKTSSTSNELVNNLLVVNKHLINKSNKDAFKNNELVTTLKSGKFDELQIVGFDICNSIHDSVLSGLKNGFKIVLNKNLTDTISPKKKEEKTLKKLKEKVVKILN